MAELCPVVSESAYASRLLDVYLPRQVGHKTLTGPKALRPSDWPLPRDTLSHRNVGPCEVLLPQGLRSAVPSAELIRSLHGSAWMSLREPPPSIDLRKGHPSSPTPTLSTSHCPSCQ